MFCRLNEKIKKNFEKNFFFVFFLKTIETQKLIIKNAI